MKKFFIGYLIWIVILVGVFMVQEVFSAADIQRGKTFGATDTVENTDLHALVDDATISNIDQSDIASNYGFVFRSGSQPSDTDALWYDTGNSLLKVYNGSSYVTADDATPDFTTLDVSGLATFDGLATFASNVSVTNNLSVDGHLFADDQFGAWDTSSYTHDTNYQAATDLIVHAKAALSSTNDAVSILGKTDSSATPSTVVTADRERHAGGSGTYYAGITFAVKNGDYWNVDETEHAGSGTTTVAVLPLD